MTHSSNPTDTQSTAKVPNDQSQQPMLAPVAYSEAVLPSLRLARSSRLARRFGRLLAVMLGLSVIATLFAPWQQSVTGSGDVIAYAPLERQLIVESPIKGRIIDWGDGIVENAHVKKGQRILEVQDIDPDYLLRLREQAASGQRQLIAANDSLAAARRKVEAAEASIMPYEEQLRAYRTVQTEIVAAADQYVKSSEQKVEAETRALEEAEAGFSQAQADYLRQKSLFEKQFASELKFQQAEQKYLEGKAKVGKAKAYLAASKNELEAKRREREAKERKAQVDIEYAQTALNEAAGKVANAQSDVGKAQGEVAKAEQALAKLDTEVSRQEKQVVEAPRDGFILKLLANQGGEMVKEGDPLVIIVPDTADRAVQIWLDGNDAPLVEPGRHVRLQFEGWPAVQFAGWPSVAVGTFGGEVLSVDSTDNGKGKFRVMVGPTADDTAWPSDRYLKQGVRANGWVLLDEVGLGYELWRRLNGFPPVVSMDEPVISAAARGSGTKK
ncbi:MAG: HlyD family efflux transporter periplasmic adaptor subunit [Planctomycetota bacterium]|nr:HlyD family efflux transporter periplasmic adaptor subunit [Planctomycetota bacterium]